MRIAFENCIVYTMDPSRPVADSLTIDGDAIVAAGEVAHSTRERIDLGGRTILPGMIDSHTHFVEYCVNVLSGVDLRRAEGMEHALELLASTVDIENTGPGKWVRGGGWDKNRWSTDRFPGRRDIDGVIEDRPVALMSRDCHALWVNSRALEAAGISAQTPDPAGGEIARDGRGDPTGILLDTAMNMVLDLVPPPPADRLGKAVETGMLEAASLGLTGVVSCEGATAFRVLGRMGREKTMPLRIWMTIPSESLEAAERIGLMGGMGDDRFEVLGVKIMLDGSLGSQTAYMDRPYSSSSDGYRGLSLLSRDELRDLVRRAAALDMPPVIHAIGDAACELAISSLERLDRGDLRARIEHAQLLRDDHPARMAARGIIASMQPAHLADDIPLIGRHWGEDRGRRAYRLGDLANAGVPLALGSDVPVAPLDPLPGVAMAAFRTDADGNAWMPGECIGVEDAFRAYTAGSAYGVSAEGRLGSLAPGLTADFVILDRDPMHLTSAREITEVRVDSTWVGGMQIYQRKGLGLFGAGTS